MRGARGFAAGVLTLIVLQVLGSGSGPERGGQLLVWVSGGVRRLLAPDVAGIPRVKRPGKQAGKGSTTGIGSGPGQSPIVVV